MWLQIEHLEIQNLKLLSTDKRPQIENSISFIKFLRKYYVKLPLNCKICMIRNVCVRLDFYF